MSAVPAGTVRLSAHLARVLAPNAGPMTLDGTNTWVLGDPGEVAPLVVDPGPDDDAHLDAVLAAAGGRIGGVLITHRHLDHTAGAASLAARAGCGVRAVDPVWRVGAGEQDLPDGSSVTLGALRLTVLSTPGHTSDSVSFLVEAPDGARLLTGDTVLGRGTSVITHPDGHLGDYLHSLDRLAQAVRDGGMVEILPGHGPVVTEPGAWLTHYREHRTQRLEQVRQALADGALSPADVVARVYGDLDPTLRAAAEQSVRAQLDHLRDLG